MDEAILLPSPNWFLVSGMTVSPDGWVFYGGPTKCLCVLEPLAPDRCVIASDHNGYRVHVFSKVHGDKVTSIDVNPVISEKKHFITGAADGTVKQWTLEKIDDTLNLKSTYSHTMHSSEREDVIGVGYSINNYAVTVGSFGRIVKWDLHSNIVRTYSLILSKFKPSCIACSPHICLQVAVGTKQGVVLVLDLSDSGTILYKVRCHDDEVLSLSWCPQYSVVMKKIKDVEIKKSVNERMERIRRQSDKQEIETFDDSAITKTLPEDSFDETLVEEDSMFDIYKDHNEDEFGHKKYKPEIIVVKEKAAKSTEFDYLAECQKLKDQILKNKEEPEPSINSLVDAFDKTHVDDNYDASCNEDSKLKKKDSNLENVVEYSKQGQKHILATIGKQGNLRVWSNKGKMLGTSILQNKVIGHNKNHHHNQKFNQPPWGTLLWYKPDVLLITDARGQLLQCNPLITDSRFKLDCYLVDTIHKRGTFCIVSNAPRVQYGHDVKDDHNLDNENQTQDSSELQETVPNQDSQTQTHTSVVPEDEWYVWTAAQDRTLVCYSMTKRRKISSYNTCGALVYNIQACPYDARKIAMCVGDGAIRVWETDVSDDNDMKLTLGHVTSFWQNVQGKVYVAAWHPIRENVLAFGTAESRVGILDTSGFNVEKPARVLNFGLTGSVYSLCWGERNDMFVCGGTDFIVCQVKKESEPKIISVQLDGEKWRLTAASWYPIGILCGSFTGSVAMLSNTTYEVLAVNFLFKKLINILEWHPQFTSNSYEESSFKDLIAVTSMDKSYKIAILKHSQNEEGKHQLKTYKYLEGHKGPVLQAAWSPHDEGRLASTSGDSSVRVWDVESGTCTAIFGGHRNGSIGLAWSAFPQLSNMLITGGSDFCVRLWKLDDHPPEAYKENLPVPLLPRRERKIRQIAARGAVQEDVSEASAEVEPDTESAYGEGRVAERMSIKVKAFKKFLLPITGKQITNCTSVAVTKLAKKYIETEREISGDEDSSGEYDMDFLKIFGTNNELNDLLDLEMKRHLEAKDTEAWIMLAIFRGQIDKMIQFASENDLLCPFLVSLAPSVSFKYWKDVTQLYLAQINRFIAQKREQKLLHSRPYGGSVFRKTALLLSLHDVKGAVDCLLEARLYRDAYVLCRVRHMDSIAHETMWAWLKDTLSNGYLKMSILCYIVLGEYYKASVTIAGETTEDESWLSLAAYLAKVSGQHTFADHLEDKTEQIKQAPKNNEIQEVEDALEQLPSRLELLLKDENSIKSVLKDDDGIENDVQAHNGINDDIKHQNGVKDESEDIETKE